eukprot:scaffold244519_cov32-Tisochrysis_lutea.AAC.1
MHECQASVAVTKALMHAVPTGFLPGWWGERVIALSLLWKRGVGARRWILNPAQRDHTADCQLVLGRTVMLDKGNEMRVHGVVCPGPLSLPRGGRGVRHLLQLLNPGKLPSTLGGATSLVCLQEILEHSVAQGKGARRRARSHSMKACNRPACVPNAVMLLQEEETRRRLDSCGLALLAQLGPPRPRDLGGGEEQADSDTRLRHLRTSE